MYKKMNRQPEFEAVELHIEGMLDPGNPWVFLAKNCPGRTWRKPTPDTSKPPARVRRRIPRAPPWAR